MRRVISFVACVLILEIWALAQGERPLLLRQPTVSRTQIVFSFAGDLWIVGREGGDARRLTSGVGKESDPFFSPDGAQVAFSGEYDGNQDVYVVPAGGGVPRRLTYHPAADTVAGWTPDGRNITFVSTRASYYHFARPDVHRASIGRLRGPGAAANCGRSIVFTRRGAPGLCAASAMADRVEALS